MLTDDELAALKRIVDAYDSDSRYVLGAADAATLRALAGRARNGGWPPIESAPREGTRVLLCGCDIICTGEWSERRRQWQTYTEDGWFEVEVYPTHWQPLPAPPREKEEG